MDPFIAYDAGFYMPPGGMFEQFGDEPLSNYMSPPNTNSKGNSANTSAVSGLNIPQNTNAAGAVTQPGLGFPWGMPTMDLDQDWSWFMNEAQSWQPSSSQPQDVGNNAAHFQNVVLP